MAKEASLKRHYDEVGKPTGLYERSPCGELFKLNLEDQNLGFKLHAEAAHKAKKPRREDVNQAAARVVREAIQSIEDKKP
jgi:hypothetical protein